MTINDTLEAAGRMSASSVLRVCAIDVFEKPVKLSICKSALFLSNQSVKYIIFSDILALRGTVLKESGYGAGTMGHLFSWCTKSLEPPLARCVHSVVSVVEEPITLYDEIRPSKDRKNNKI